MKRKIDVVLAALFAALLMSGTAQATLVYTDTATGATDLGLPTAPPFSHIGPGGIDDTTPFGPGSWEITGVINQVVLGDDGDAWNFSTTGEFELNFTASNENGPTFVRTSNGFNAWTGDVDNPTHGPVHLLALPAGDYNFGFFEGAVANYDWQIVVAGPAIPEPSTMVLALLGLVGMAGCRRRRRSCVA